MHAEPTFYAPVGYSVWWPLLGVALLLLCGGVLAWIWVATKPRPSTGVPEFVAPRNPDSVKAKYLALISSLQNQYDAGTRDGRATHLELSLAVRSFAHEMTGIKTQRMTLAQLRQHHLPLAEDAVAQFYPGEFSRAGEHQSVAASVQAARNVVSQWR